MVRNDETRNEPEQAASYLSRYDIHASIKIVDRVEDRIDVQIAKEARNFCANYVVMGAYGRGRLRQTFGGVTKRMLRDSELPLLLAR